MKQKNKMKLLIEYISLFPFQLHVTTVLVAQHVKQTGDCSSLDLLASQTGERESIVEWIHAHTPVRFNRKKKKFVNRGGGRWELQGGLSSNIIIARDSLSRFTEKYHLRTLGDLESVLSVVQAKMEKLDERVAKDETIITEDDIEQVAELSAREQIRAYLAANPSPEAMGKFGLPQCRYRHGTYGLRSMEFNEWSR